MVLNILLHIDSSKDNEDAIAECDIDMYLYGVTSKEANQKIDEIHKVYAANMGPESKHIVMKTAKTISFIPQYPQRRIQIVLKLHSSPLESLLRVDLDACSLAFDGSRVLMLPRCARALETGYSVFTMDLIWGHRLGNRRETQMHRVWKYASRGFGLRILPSHCRSLEMDSSPDTTLSDPGRSFADGSKLDTGVARIFENEPGLKTLRRIRHYAQQYARRVQLGPSGRLDGRQPEYILSAITSRASNDVGIPDPGNSRGHFEVLMRRCEAWSLDAIGQASLDIPELYPEKFAYDDLEIYDGLPTYKWGSKSTDDMERLKDNANYYNSYLYRRLVYVILEKLNISPGQFWYHKFGFAGRKGYLTNRSSRLIAGDDARSVQARNFALPLVIPKALQTYIAGTLTNRYDDLPDYNALSKVLIPVHDPESYNPTTEMMPSLRDTLRERGNIRYWSISNESMWAGQHRVLDEVAELLLMLFNWTTPDLPDLDRANHARRDLRTDDPHCIWYIADYLRRRLILPKTSNTQQGSQNVSDREGHLFGAWVLARPPRWVARQGSHFDADTERILRIENELEGQRNIANGSFWRDGDEGTWDSEPGVPVWGDFEDVFSRQQTGAEDTFDMSDISAWFEAPF